MKRSAWKVATSLAVIFTLAVAPVVLTGCGDDSGGATESGEPASAPAADAESVETQLQQTYGDSEWFGAVGSIGTVMKLRHPVWEVRFDVTVGEVRDNDWVNEVLWAFSDLGLDGYYVDVRGTDGIAGSGGSGGGESVVLPAPPGSAEDMAAWMDEAYGPGSGDTIEAWYGHIVGYDFETDAWDGAAVLVVKTDLANVGFEWSPEREMVDLIRYAVSSSGVTWATDLRIEDVTETNLSTGDLRPDMVPYKGY